jgi:hypothetical protein
VTFYTCGKNSNKFIGKMVESVKSNARYYIFIGWKCFSFTMSEKGPLVGVVQKKKKM